MSRKVAIYIRVSTKKQATLGESLEHQKRVLTLLCEQKGWEIVGIYQDEKSAKDFEHRPSFNQFLQDLKLKIIKPNILLVLSTDRFSRKGWLGMSMENRLKEKYNVDVVFSDRDYDPDNPLSILMKHIDYGYAEMNNAFKGIKTRGGMIERTLQGKFPSKAPRGYKNVTIGDDKVMIIDDEVAPFIRKAFEEVAKGIYSTNEIRRQLQKEGFKMSTAQFYNMLRNVVYMGKILQLTMGNEPRPIGNGIHEPIITEQLFRTVQNVIDGKNKPYVRSSKHKENLPLRKHLVCPECGKPITGSRSKGGSGIWYYYYHCQKGCQRYQASQINDGFIQLLESFDIPTEYKTLYKEALMGIISSQHKTQKDKLREIDKQVQQHQEKLTEAEDKLLDGIFSDSTYKRVADRYGKAIDELLSQRVDISLSASPIEEYVESGLTLMTDLPKYYTNADADTKSMMVSSIFPEKLEYDGEIYRTPKLNAFIAQIASYIKVYEECDKEKASISESLSTEVAPTRIELVSKV